MAAKGAASRLRKELVNLHKDPPPYVRVAVDERDLLQWEYLLEGPPDSPYHGGWYHGRLRFPKEYPFKPPEIVMITPSGRFEVNTPLCLSMSSFHPETWNPMWSVGTVLTGLLSFMLEATPTTGSIESTDTYKRRLARESLAWNLARPQFRRSFPTVKAPAPTPAPPGEEEAKAHTDGAAAAAAGLVPPSVAEHIALGDKAHAAGDHAEAERCLSAALLGGPDPTDRRHCLLTRGATRLAVGDYGGALADGEAAVAAAVAEGHDAAAGHLLAARACLPLGRPDDGRAHLHAAESAPDGVGSSSLDFPAEYAAKLAAARHALDDCRRVVDTADARSALTALDAALAVCPASGALRRDRVEALLRLGEFEEAAEALLRAAAAPADRDAAHRRLAQVRSVVEKKARGNAAYAAGDWRAAVRAYSEALTIIPSAPLHANYAAVLQRQGKWAAAIDHCGRALRLDPQYHKVRARRAACHVALGQAADAARDYAALCAADPGNEEYRRLAAAAASAPAPAPSPA